MKKYLMKLNNVKEARRIFCKAKCEICPIASSNNGTGEECHRFAAMYPDKAAELMGLEVIETEDKPCLTEAELAICKAAGAKWVSRNECNYDNVNLWKIEPTSPRQYIARNGGLLASVNVCLFPSLNPGDCINVEDLMK